MALTEAQRQAAECVAQGMTYAEAGKISQTTHTTVWRWHQNHEEFRALVRRMVADADERSVRRLGHNLEKNSARLCSIADKLAWRMQLDDGKPDLPVGQPSEHTAYLAEYRATLKEMREQRDATTNRRIREEESARNAERWAIEQEERRKLMEAQSVGQPGSADSSATDGAADIPDNGRAD